MAQGVSALAVASTKVVAEPRFAPGGARLGWLEAADGLTALMVAPTDGSAPPVSVTGELVLGGGGAYRGGVWCWVDAETVAVATLAGALAGGPGAGGAATGVAPEGHAPAAGGRPP